MHVTTGVIILLIVAIRSAKGKATAMGVENAGLYWHFVDLVWVFVFALFYLV
jgi:cytochrome c oxidase subunit 3